MKSMKVLVVDIGGTHVKVLAAGRGRQSFPSGPKLTPKRMLLKVRALAADWDYDAVSIGYPGPVLRDRVVKEPWNLGKGWVGFNFETGFKRPVKLVNDAALQALGSYEGGKMLFLGFGTGLGSALIVDGVVAPMAATCTEILVRLRQPPTMYGQYDLDSNYVRLRISPDVVHAFGFNITSPVEESQSILSELLASRHPCAKEMDAYERVLGDAMAGDATPFAREDYVEEAWRIVDPALKSDTPLYEYEPRTWGPTEAQSIEPPGGWQNPIINREPGKKEEGTSGRFFLHNRCPDRPPTTCL